MSPVPAISVIIPTRNTLRYLPKAIDSIGAHPDIEIIVINDGSTDGTAEWLADYRERDPRLIELTGPGRNSARARNLGIAAARAPLIAFLDADDWWEPGKLDAQCKLHRAHPQIGFSFTDYRHLTPAGEDRGSSFTYWSHYRARHGHRTEPFLLGGDALAQIYAENIVGTSTVMARTDALRATGGFDETLRSAEDWDLWLRLAASAPVGCHPEPLVTYLMHRPGNKSARVDRRISAVRQIGDRFRDLARQQDRAAVRIFNARVLVATAEVAQTEGKLFRSVALRLGALLRHPTRRAGREMLAGAAAAAHRVVTDLRSAVPHPHLQPDSPRRSGAYGIRPCAATGIPVPVCVAGQSRTTFGSPVRIPVI
jgi:glycosyltransferase involved in cell wall biosynthesis